MADDGLSFRRGTRKPPKGVGGLLVLLLMAALLLALSRPLWQPAFPDGELVEVRGDVPRPGMHSVQELTVHAAVRAAGGAVEGLEDGPLAPGDRVEVADGRARVVPPSNPLLIALPIDVNAAPASELEAIPGVGARTARAIVDERERAGPYRSLDDLARARGVGASTLELLAPFVTVPPAPPVDLNSASVAELERLPGIGPVLAARIVVERADGGPFTDLADLERVEGVGDALRGLAEARP